MPAGKFVSHIDYWDAVSGVLLASLGAELSQHARPTPFSSACPLSDTVELHPAQVENQQFLSLEAVRHLISQLTTLAQAPRGLDTPDFLVLRRFADCDVRRWGFGNLNRLQFPIYGY